MVRLTNPRNIVGCNYCNQKFVLDATDEQFAAWDTGELIQDAMPNLSADDRELLISGTCNECWARMFGEPLDF